MWDVDFFDEDDSGDENGLLERIGEAVVEAGSLPQNTPMAQEELRILMEAEVEEPFPTFDTANVVTKLLDSIFQSSKEEGEEKLKRFFSWAVPFCYKPRKSLSPLSKLQLHIDGSQSERAKALLFPLLDGLIDKDKELSNYFTNLEAFSTPSICGKLFKVGEPIYSCLDCALDPTCVLCSSCFNQSNHKTHRYRVSSSRSGGGYCDCGDEEAWKADKFCLTHQPKNATSTNTNANDASVPLPLPPHLEARVKSLLHLLLDYSCRVLTSLMSLALPPDIQLYENEQGMADLPPAVKSFVEEEVHCTVLYNDEYHSFDTVINALRQALGCNQRQATTYATIVDREGRSIVKISSYQECYQAKSIIEQATSRPRMLEKPLKTVILQTHLVAHQTFALHLIKWIQDLLEKSAAIRAILGDIVQTLVVDKALNLSMLDAAMRKDVTLWKTARKAFHHLFIAGMLKEYELKKKFSEAFAKNYAIMTIEFMGDDHKLSFSMLGLSVQIFTVPSIAHFLIESQDIFTTIMGCFKDQWQQNLNGVGMLEMDEESGKWLLKSTTVLLKDLEYVLTFPPTTSWSDKLTRNFNRGLESVVNLLRAMEGMCASTRQVGVHVEHEKKTNHYFALHSMVQPVISLLFKWLRKDKDVLWWALSHSLQELGRLCSQTSQETVRKEFVGHAATCLVFDVSSSPISFHNALSRFVTGLLLLLQEHNIEVSSASSQAAFRRALDENQNVPQLVMESALRVQVMAAQICSGMWKRNGFSLVYQLYYYLNVNFRLEMVDRDIIALQLGGSLMEPNEFCIHLLNRFDLFGWAEGNITTTNNTDDGEEEKERNMMFSEFLSLIINIFASRFVPNVGLVSKRDCVRKEIIQLLCLGPMTHSTLSKGLVGDGGGNVSNQLETRLEEVIEEIALLKRGKGDSATVFHLKPELYNEYDWHFFHYTKEEISKAEGQQRERKRNDGVTEDLFPPPVLPPFTPCFDRVVNILKADVFLKIITIALERCIQSGRDGKSTVVDQCEAHLRKVLHLIGHGLNEEISAESFQFCEACEKWKVFEKLEELSKQPTFSQHWAMITWIRNKREQIHPQAGESGAVAERDEEMKQIVVAGPAELDERKKKAAEMRAKALAKMSAAQEKFRTVNADLFEPAPGQRDEPSGAEAMSTSPPSPSLAVALGPNQSPLKQDDESHICILCREEHPLQKNSKGFLLSAFIQRSTVLCDDRSPARELETSSDKNFVEDCELWMRRNILMAPHFSSCGHIMHESCWVAYVEGVKTRERRRPFRHPHSFDVNKEEWLCPMCDCLCNAALPMTPPPRPPPLSQKPTDKNLHRPLSFSAYLSSMEWKINKAELESETEMEEGRGLADPVENVDAPLTPETAARGRPVNDELLNQIFSRGPRTTRSPTPSLFRRLFQRGRQLHSDTTDTREVSSSRTYYRPSRNQNTFVTTFMERTYAIARDADYDQDYGRSELHRCLWQSLAYSIMSAEICHRDQGISFFGENVPIRSSMGLKFLTRFCSYTSTFSSGGANDDDESSPIPSWLLEWEGMQYLSQIWGAQANLPSMLEVDAFGLLVFLTYLMPYSSKRLKGGGWNLNNHHHNLRLAFTICVFQLLMSVHDILDHISPRDNLKRVPYPLSVSVGENLSSEDSFPMSDSLMRSFLCELWQAPRAYPEGDGEFVLKNLDSDMLWTRISRQTIPFLRCCAKFYESMTGISPPPGLELELGDDQFGSLVKYLDLPRSFYELFDSVHVCAMLTRWSKHPSNHLIMNPHGSVDIPKNLQLLHTLSLPRVLGPLTELPEDYTELLSLVAHFKCSKSDAYDSQLPTMCLVCGAVLCSGGYCCQQELKSQLVGACTHHAYFCSGGVGIFLRIRECRLFFLNGRDRGSYITAPYLDEYGEADEGFQRGNPLKLSREKYEHIRKLWIQHGIPEEVSRITENSSLGGMNAITNWVYF